MPPVETRSKEMPLRPNPFRSVGEAISVVKEMFPANYVTPWWGTKMTSGIRGMGTIHNLGYVIGFRDDAAGRRFRLDYDPNSDKQFHINYQGDTPWERRFGIITPYVLQGGDEMWNFYCTWTTQHCDEAPALVREKLGPQKVWRGKHWA